MTSQLLFTGKQQPPNCNTAKFLQNPSIQELTRQKKKKKLNSTLKKIVEFPFKLYYTLL